MTSVDDIPGTGGVRWLDDREQAAWRGFIEVQARLNARLSREMQRSSGVSMADFSVLAQLSEQDGDQLRVLALARALEWEKSRLSHQLTRMEQRGLLRRTGCNSDRRGAFVTLTPLGRSTVEAVAPEHVASVRRYFVDRLDTHQLAALSAISEAVLTALADAPESAAETSRDD